MHYTVTFEDYISFSDTFINNSLMKGRFIRLKKCECGEEQGMPLFSLYCCLFFKYSRKANYLGLYLMHFLKQTGYSLLVCCLLNES